MGTGRSFFTTLPSRVLEDDAISDTAAMVLANLAAFSDREGWCEDQVIRNAAQRRGVTRQAIMKHVEVLVEAGYVTKHSTKRDDGGIGANRYRIVWDPLQPQELQAPATSPATLGVATSSYSRNKKGLGYPQAEGADMASTVGLRNWAEKMGWGMDPNDEPDYVRSALRAMVEDDRGISRDLYDELVDIGVEAWQRNRPRSAPIEERYG